MNWLVERIYAAVLALDLLLSALTGGEPLETCSARFAQGRLEGKPFGTFCANLTDTVALKVFSQPDHCNRALAAYQARNAVAPAYSG